MISFTRIDHKINHLRKKSSDNYLDPFALIWTRVESFEHVWSHLDPFHKIQIPFEVIANNNRPDMFQYRRPTRSIWDLKYTVLYSCQHTHCLLDQNVISVTIIVINIYHLWNWGKYVTHLGTNVPKTCQHNIQRICVILTWFTVVY